MMKKLQINGKAFSVYFLRKCRRTSISGYSRSNKAATWNWNSNSKQLLSGHLFASFTIQGILYFLVATHKLVSTIGVDNVSYQTRIHKHENNPNNSVFLKGSASNRLRSRAAAAAVGVSHVTLVTQCRTWPNQDNRKALFIMGPAEFILNLDDIRVPEFLVIYSPKIWQRSPPLC